MMRDWTKDHKLAVAGLVIAILALLVGVLDPVTGLLSPEIRQWLGLEDNDPIVEGTPIPITTAQKEAAAFELGKKGHDAVDSKQFVEALNYYEQALALEREIG